MKHRRSNQTTDSDSTWNSASGRLVSNQFWDGRRYLPPPRRGDSSRPRPSDFPCQKFNGGFIRGLEKQVPVGNFSRWIQWYCHFFDPTADFGDIFNYFKFDLKNLKFKSQLDSIYLRELKFNYSDADFDGEFSGAIRFRIRLQVPEIFAI